jgi:hypothetical protein
MIRLIRRKLLSSVAQAVTRLRRPASGQIPAKVYENFIACDG